MESVKIVLLGDNRIGKSAIQSRLVQDYVPEYVQTDLDVYTISMTLDSTVLQLKLWDFGGSKREIDIPAVRHIIEPERKLKMTKITQRLHIILGAYKQGLNEHICRTIALYYVEVSVREVIYPGVDLFVSAFEFWLQEKRKYSNAPVAVLGLKSDQKHAVQESEIESECIKRCTIRGEFTKYYTLSATSDTAEDITNVFREIAAAALRSRRSIKCP
ncbi:hypothetical protein AAMO2058_001476800 [Amorphochlora amoebiformis]